MQASVSIGRIGAKLGREVGTGGRGLRGRQHGRRDAGGQRQGGCLFDHDEGLLADAGVGLQLARDVARVDVIGVAAVADLGDDDCYSVLFSLVYSLVYL